MGTDESATQSRKRLWIVVTVGALFVIVFLLQPVTIRREWSFLCRNTGSWEGHREWFWGGTSGHWRKASRLEAFMAEAHPGELRYDWVTIGGTGYNVLGRAISSVSGSPGPIYSAAAREALFDAYVESLSPEEKLALYHRFASGNDALIRKEVDKIMG